ncbi:unnamed protein product [Cylindrotheca closterium]|uniref:Protein prenyltransferase alpha subunit repeat-containing protein 1 n=1 Tax=Cylindrotheca closterium TaxID=2856 RepID=A0AAD2GAM0_9STRA|nr:unnamed protein product [Cylindrotheca closterium]
MATQSLSAVVQKLHDYVQQGPTDFEITILPTVMTKEMETDELSLDESLVLMEGQFLGMDARSLPWMTRVIRKDYKALKKKAILLDAAAGAAANDGSSTSASSMTDVNNNALHHHHSQILMATNALMLVNPDHSTAWGDRRRALIATSGDWVREMQFLNLLMTQHSKAPSSWGHRKYVLQQIVKAIVVVKEISDDYESKLVDLVHKEIAFCSKIADKFPKNYYAWTHRRYLWSSCILPHLQQSYHATIIVLLNQEFDALKLWLEQHISDHSAVHYLGQVLEMRLQQQQDQQQQQHIQSSSSSLNDLSISIAHNSLNLANALLKTHPDHESLWILRRLMVQILFQHAQQHSVTDSAKVAILSMLEDLIDEVWTKAHFSENNRDYNISGITSVYAWSFLVWCMSQLGLGGQDRPKRLLDGLAFLQSSENKSHVYHEMWKTNGEEILFAK